MSLIVKISADTSAFKRSVNTISRDIQGFGKDISKMGDAFKPVTYAAAGIFTAAIKSGSEFEAKMSEVSAIGQIYGKDLDKLTEKAKQIGLETKFSASEAADGLLYMGQAGWSAQESLDGIDGVMTLAAAGALDVGRASDIVTDAITAMGYSAKDTSKFVDILAVSASSTNTTVDVMGETFKYSASVAGTLGINLEDLSLAIGLMANQSVKGSRAGTALRSGLTNLAKPTKQMQLAMEKYNVSLITNEDGSVNLRATMENLRSSMANLSETEKIAALGAIFGKTALSGWAAIVNSSDDDFNSLANAIDNSNGKAKEMQQTMMDNTQGSIEIMLSSIQGALQAVFESISPVITDVAKTITDLANKFGALDKGTQKFIVTGLAIGALVAPVMKVVGAVVKLGGKIAAIPVAMQKMQKGQVERQVNAWLKWNNVTDQQASKLRKVARDIDTVKRGGAGAENAAKRLAKAMGKVDVPPDVVPDLNKVGNAAKDAERKVGNLNREMKGMKVKGVRGIKVDGSSVDIDVPSINKKVQNSNLGKSVGKTVGSSVGKETAQTLGNVLGSELGSTIGSKMGPIGTIIGDIIGESAGEGLAKAVTGGSSFAKVISFLPKLFNPVTLGVGAFAGGLIGLTKILSTSKDDFSLWGSGVDETGKKVEGFSTTNAEANEILKDFSHTWENFDTEGNLKKYEIKVDVNYEEETKNKIASMEQTLQEHFNKKIEMIQNSNRYTEEEKERYIGIIKEQEEKLIAAQTESIGRQMEFEKKFNEDKGYARYEAGKIMFQEELRRNEMIEKALATTNEEKLEIEKKYADLRNGALGQFITENYDTIKQGLEDEVKAIADSGNDKLDELERQNKERIKTIKETYGEDTREYRAAMREQATDYARKKEEILQGTREEIDIAQERINKIKEDIIHMKDQGKITKEEAEKMLTELNKFQDLEYNPKVVVNEYGIEEIKDSLEEIDKYNGKVTQATMSIDKKPFDENTDAIEKKMQELRGQEIRPVAGIDRTPWGEHYNGIEKDVENINKKEMRPSVFLDKVSFDITAEEVREKLAGMTKQERTVWISMNNDKFMGKNFDVMEILRALEEEEKEAPLGADTTKFEQGYENVKAKCEELGYKIITPEVGATIVEFEGKAMYVDELLKNLDATEVAALINANPEPFIGHEEVVKEKLKDLELIEVYPTANMETITFDGKVYKVNKTLEELNAEKPTPTTGMETSPFFSGKRQIDTTVQNLNNTTATIGTKLDQSGYDSGRWSLSNWIKNNPIYQTIKTVFSGGDSGGGTKKRATGGQIGSGTTIVGERGPEIVSRRGNSVTVQPLRATDRAMGGWSDKDLVGSKGGDIYNVTIVGVNKSARELFDEIEQYKSTVSRSKGTRRF